MIYDVNETFLEENNLNGRLNRLYKIKKFGFNLPTWKCIDIEFLYEILKDNKIIFKNFIFNYNEANREKIVKILEKLNMEKDIEPEIIGKIDGESEYKIFYYINNLENTYNINSIETIDNVKDLAIKIKEIYIKLFKENLIDSSNLDIKIVIEEIPKKTTEYTVYNINLKTNNPDEIYIVNNGYEKVLKKLNYNFEDGILGEIAKKLIFLEKKNLKLGFYELLFYVSDNFMLLADIRDYKNYKNLELNTNISRFYKINDKKISNFEKSVYNNIFDIFTYILFDLAETESDNAENLITYYSDYSFLNKNKFDEIFSRMLNNTKFEKNIEKISKTINKENERYIKKFKKIKQKFLKMDLTNKNILNIFTELNFNFTKVMEIYLKNVIIYNFRYKLEKRGKYQFTILQNSKRLDSLENIVKYHSKINENTSDKKAMILYKKIFYNILEFFNMVYIELLGTIEKNLSRTLKEYTLEEMHNYLKNIDIEHMDLKKDEFENITEIIYYGEKLDKNMLKVKGGDELYFGNSFIEKIIKNLIQY